MWRGAISDRYMGMVMLPNPTPTPSRTRPATTMAMWTAPADRPVPTRNDSAAAAMTARRPKRRVRGEAASEANMPAM